MEQNTEQNVTRSIETEAAQQKTAKGSRKAPRQNAFQRQLDRITACKSVGHLVFKAAMMILVPYLYIFVCGYLDSYLLSTGFTYRDAFVLFVFLSLMLFWLIALILIVLSIVRWRRGHRAK